jgi:hypothetical protein
VKAFLKEIEDLHAGHAGAMSTAKLVNTMRRDPNLPATHFLNMINSAENEALYHNVRTRVEEGLLVRIWNPADQYLSDGVRLLHAIFQDAITPKDSDVSIRTDNKFANEIKPVQFNENKVLMARFKTWKFTADRFDTNILFLLTTLLEKFMFHPHLSTDITKYWEAQTVKDQLALDNLFVHTEIIINQEVHGQLPV